VLRPFPPARSVAPAGPFEPRQRLSVKAFPDLFFDQLSERALP